MQNLAAVGFHDFATDDVGGGASLDQYVGFQGIGIYTIRIF